MPDPWTPMPRAARLAVMREAEVLLWRGCVLVNGEIVLDTARTGFRTELDVYMLAGCGWRGSVSGRKGGELAFPDPDEEANWGHLDRVLAERHGLRAWRGVEYEPFYGSRVPGGWGIEGWRLRAQEASLFGPPCAWLGHPEIPDTADGIRDLRVLALREAKGGNDDHL